MPNRLIQETAIDYFTGQVIVYPRPSAKLAFDFLFRKPDGKWYYMNSFNEVSVAVEAQKLTTVKAGGEWRIVAPQCGYIVHSSHH